jgi:hypothetical protein
MKLCPNCSEQIQDAAIKCRFCHSWLVPPPSGYAPAPALTMQPPRQTSGMAIASLVLGILWIYWIGSILALIFGYVAKGEIRRSTQKIEGNGLATAGIVLGWVGVGTLVLVIVFVFIAALMEPDRNKSNQKNTSTQSSWINPPREPVPGPQPTRYFLPGFRLPS